MGRDRLTAFSDGVIAIIITIMVLELKVPHGADWNALGSLLPGVQLVVSHCGWLDLEAVARSSDLYWHWLREYGRVEDSSSYERETIATAAIDPNIRVLLSHGCGDAHIPMGEAVALYRSLEATGHDVQLMMLPDEGHTIRKPANVATWYRWVLEACHTSVGVGAR